jgi:sugar phosphate isomerase/epimerase
MLNQDYTRRRFLGDSLKTAAAITIAPRCLLGAAPAGKDKPATASAPVMKKVVRDDSAAEKLGWRVSMASYTLRAMTFMEAVDVVASLGLKYLDVHPSITLSKDNKVKTNHLLPAELRDQMKKKLQEAGVKAVGFGVTGVSAKEEDARKLFQFAKDMGIENINCEARPDLFAMLDRLTEEFGVNIALHNHPKPSSYYWDPATVLKSVEGHSKRIGACADVGHWTRSDLVPVECLKKLKGRIICFHFKDVVQAGKGYADAPWGTGLCDVKGMLAEVKSQGFKGVFGIEYERGTGQELLDNITKSVAFFDRTAAELLKG